MTAPTNGPAEDHYAADKGRRPMAWSNPDSNPDEGEVLELIRRAERHELGRDFLAKGALDAVAATFGVHAFVVDAARERLATGD